MGGSPETESKDGYQIHTKCGSKCITASRFIEEFDPDEEPYKEGVREDCDTVFSEGINIGIIYCRECDEIVHSFLE